MIATQHHISDELLLEYAAGGLEEAWCIAVATHLAFCPECRERLEAIEAAGGMLMECIEPEAASVSEDASWAALSARLEGDDERETDDGQESRAGSGGKPADVPEPLRSYIGGSLSGVKWKRLGVGAEQFVIDTEDGSATARLLRIPAGKPVPEHSHNGRELTLVLTGSFVSEGVTFGPGDFEEEDDETEHQPMVTPDGECICLTVTDAPLRFRSRIVRLVQPFLGI